MNVRFDDDGRLYWQHNCEGCQRFPLEDMNTPCLLCGYSKRELIHMESRVNRANQAIDLMGKHLSDNDSAEVESYEAFLQIAEIKLGGNSMDKMILQDLDMTDEIRSMAHLTEHMVRVIIYPTNMRMIEGDEIYHEELEGDDEE